MDIYQRRVKFFRTHIDASIGPNPKLAYSTEDDLLKAIDFEAELTELGIYARWVDKRNKNEVHEHLVPFANIQSIKLHPITNEVLELKRKPKSGAV